MRPERCRSGRCGAMRGGAVPAALLLALVAAALACCWSALLDRVISQSMRLTPGFRGYEEWVSPSLPIYFDVYLFNWTNPERLAAGESPHLVELGPYRYRETRHKTNISWHPHNDSVSYAMRRVWTFQPLLSNGSLDDLITTLDVVGATAAYRARHWGSVWQTMLSATLGMGRRELWTRRRAAELLFAGYEDPLLLLTSLLPAELAPPPPANSYRRFGWFYERNGSLDNDGYVTVSTGGDGLAGQILRWNFRDTLPHFDAPCNRVEGSVGEFFPRGDAAAALFSPDLCRPLPLDSVGSGAVHGLLTRRLAVGARALRDEPCVCGGECVAPGALNVSACRFGAPAFVSLPHFLHADPQHAGAVRGLAADPARHAFYIDVEPTTGVPLDVAARFQLNILLAPHPHIGLYAHAPRLLLPVLWVEQRVLVSAQTAAALTGAAGAAAWGGPLAGAVAVAALLAAVLLATRCPHCAAAATPASPAAALAASPAAGPSAELATLVST